MTDLQFKIFFKKFKKEASEISFSEGLNVVYGDSGVGKSNLMLAIQGKKCRSENNFEIFSNNEHLKYYSLYQNPDHQILAMTVKGELAFSGECLQLPPSQLESIIYSGLSNLPDSIDPDLNPGYLSGGEKELLNLITAVQMDVDVLLMDDALSFLSVKNKTNAIQWLKDWVKRSNGIVIWLTSEKEDLNYGDSQWILALDSLYDPGNISSLDYDPIQIPTGDMGINFENVDFHYSDSSDIYLNLSLKVKNARCLGLIGQNGSGKTTFASLCFDYLKPNKGQVKLVVKDNLSPKIGYLDQFPDHLIQLDTLEQLFNKLKDNNVFDIGLRNTFIKRLTRFGIQWNKVSEVRGDKIPWVVLRTVMVVLLAHCKFDILILDEPTFGLGWDQRLILRSFLRDRMSNMHFMIISHDEKFVNSLCDQVLNINTLEIKRKTVGATEKIKP